MELNITSHNTFKTKYYTKFFNIFFSIANNTIKSKKDVNNESILKKKEYNYYKTYNKSGYNLINQSIFKYNVKLVISGLTFLVKTLFLNSKKYLNTKKNSFNNNILTFSNFLVIKIENKIYNNFQLQQIGLIINYNHNILTFCNTIQMKGKQRTLYVFQKCQKNI
jgi:hypothetical protein